MIATRGARRPAGVVLGTTLAVAVPLGFIAVFFLLPLGGMLALGLFPEGALDLAGFAEVFGRERTLRIIGLTLAQAGVATALAVLLGVPVAYALHRLRIPGGGLLRALVLVPFVLPTVVVGVAFRTLFRPGGLLGGLGLDASFAGIVLALVFFNVAVVVRTVGARWEALDQRQEEAAASLGASPWRRWRSITLPALAPAIWSAAAVVFLFCATAFGTVLVLGGLQFGTIETEIYFLTMHYLDLPAAAALSIAQLVVIAVLLAVVGRLRRSGERVGRASRPARPVRLRPGHAWAVGWTLLVVGALMLPLGALLLRSLQTAGGFGLGNYLALASPGAVAGGGIWAAIGFSLLTALQAAAIAIVLGLVIAVLLSRPVRSARLRRLQGLFDALVMLPLGVSAVTIGLGVLVTLNRPPLDVRTSWLLIPITQALIALPLVLRTLLPMLRSIDHRLRETAATLGAAPGRVLRDVDLRLAARPIAAAAAFAFAVSLGEFGATTFLIRPDMPTLPVLVYRLIGRPGEENLGMALAASVILALVILAVTGLVERLRAGVAGAF